jgi:hypothetical protein
MDPRFHLAQRAISAELAFRNHGGEEGRPDRPVSRNVTQTAAERARQKSDRDNNRAGQQAPKGTSGSAFR